MSCVLLSMVAPTTSFADRLTGNDGPPLPATAEKKVNAKAHRARQPLFNRTITMGAPRWISVAQRYKGTNPTGRKSLWCADFMNLVLKRSGLEGTSSSMARSFASYGKRLPGPRVGAIAVLARGKNGGHVGIVTGVDEKGNPTLISGNHGNKVAESTYPKGRVIAYVWPTG